MSANFKTYIPQIKIENKTILGNDYNLGEFLKRGNGSSNLDQPANTVTLEFVPTSQPSYPGYTGVNTVPYWLKTIKKNDLISVGIDSEKSFLYKIDGIFRTKVLTQTGAEVGIRIIGRSLISVLLDDDITFAPDLAHNSRSIKLLGALRSTFLGFIDGMRGLIDNGQGSEFLAQHPLVAVVWIFLNMPAVNAKIFYVDYDENGNPLGRANVKTVGALFDFDFMAYEKDVLYDPQLNTYTGKVWNYVMQCIDPMFYELFEETRIVNGQLRPTIFIRPKPFDRTTDNERITGDVIISAKVERDGDVEKGDFIIKEKEVKFANLTTKVYEVTFKGYENLAFKEGKATVEPVSLYWDNENVQGNTSLRNAFKTCITKENFHTVPDNEDFECSVGSTTQNIVNFITMHSMKDLVGGDELAKWGYLFPIVDSYSLLQYGCRRMEGRTLMMHSDAQGMRSWKDYAGDKTQFDKNVPEGAKVFPIEETITQRDRLFSWYRYNPLFLSGMGRVLGHDYYRKGDKIYFPQHYSEDGYYGVYYYIKGVNWRYEVNQGGTSYFTYLDLDRGENPTSLKDYRRAAGYDLYDLGLEVEPHGSPGEQPRQNPVLRVDAVLVTPTEESTIQKTEAQDVRNEVGYNKKTNPHNDNSVDGNGYDKLTDTSLNAIKNGYNKFVKADGTYGLEKVSLEQVISTIYQAGQDNGINPNILVAQINHESAGFNPLARSQVKDKKGRISNAVGLGQHMGFPENAKYFSRPISAAYTSPLDQDGRYDAIENILATGAFLQEKGWNKTLTSKIIALNNYYGKGGSNINDEYIPRLRIKTFLPNTELKT